MITSLFAEVALLPSGWAHKVRVTITAGRISAVEQGGDAQSGDEHHRILLPGMPNLHSHAFQRGMAGLAEMRGPASDNFWSWRTVMYRFALTMSPEQVHAIAAQLYVEMLEAGFTRVGEFHYLHHAPDGTAYDNISELAEQIAGAAAATGIGLTLLPVFYAHHTFGGVAPVEGQRRFICSLDSFAALIERCRVITTGLPGAVLGVAPHSLRAVTPEELAEVVAMAGSGPIHIHAAEQVKEVEDCLDWSGLRPVEWLLAHQPIDGRWCVIHATHMTPTETHQLAATGAVAGLCPMTEANLGDGVFPAMDFVQSGGLFGIGSDSNILIGVADELRQLEYAQRLFHRARNLIAMPGESTGQMLFERATKGGAVALASSSAILVGESADLVSLSQGVQLDHKTVLDRWIFSGGIQVNCVWVRGIKLVANGRHCQREVIYQRFTKAMQQLINNS